MITLIKKNINFNKIQTPPNIEAITIEIYSKTNKLIVTNIYIPPAQKTEKQTINSFFTNTNTIITGDFNAYNPLWSINLNTATTQLGKTLEEIITENNYININTGLPTFQRNNGTTSCLDLAFCSNTISNKCNWTALQDTLGSDHFPTLITYNNIIDKDNINTKTWMLHKADWNKFKETCENLFTKNNITTNIPITQEILNNQNYIITHNIIKAANTSIPIFQSNHNTIKKTPYWTKDLSQATTDRNNARKKMTQTKNIEDCINYHKLKGITQYKIREAAKLHWTDYCDSLDSATKLGQVWRESKNMNNMETNNNHIPNLTINNNNKTTTTQEKAEALANQFAFNSSDENYTNTFITNRTQHLSNPNFSTDNSTIQQQQLNELNTPITLAELKTAIDTAEQKSSPGPDTITYSMLKNLSHIALTNILNIYNNIFNCGEIPETWKHAIITPIPKPGKDNTIPANYRPISQTNTLCKILERIITNRIQHYLETHNKFNKFQTGFRKGLSTTDQLIKIQNEITKSLRSKSLTIAVFLDFEKAYDMVWRPGLLHKCNKLGINGKIFNYIESFITNRTFQVKINNTLSTIKNQLNGTPQGSVISSLLFLIMINDISPASNDILMSLYADDSSTYTSGNNIAKMFKSMQTTLNKISSWCEEWGFKLSPSKSKLIIFSRIKKFKQTKLTLNINNQIIKKEESIKFLGMILDSNLTFNEHINYIIDRCTKRLNLMRNLCGTRWGATLDTLLVIYKTLVRSVIEYGDIVYYNISKTNSNKLNSLQYKALKIVCGSMTGAPLEALQNETGELPLHLSRHKHQLVYYAKVKSNAKHPSQNIIHYPANTKYYNRPNLDLFNMNTDTIFKQHQWTLNTTNNTSHTPWLNNKIITDETLLHKFKKFYTLKEKLDITTALINSYTNSLHIYTDGTLQHNGSSASGYYIPTYNNITTNRNTNNTPILTAELIAIQNAIEYVATHTDQINIAIYTDSIETLNRINLDSLKLTIKTSQIANNIKQLAVTHAHITIHLIWIPSHIGITGNEIIDQHTQTATSQQIDTSPPSDLIDIKQKIDIYITEQWQKQYITSTKAQTYKTYEPTVNTKIKALRHVKRIHQKKITRLKVGRCNLNSYQHQNGFHPSGLCTYCNTLENIEHHIIHCAHYNYIHKLQPTLTKLNTTPTLQNILKNNILSLELAKLIKQPI